MNTNENARAKLSMNIVNIAPSLYEAGKVKIGRKGKERQGQNGPYQQPEKLDHFIITKTHRGTDGNFLLDTETMKVIKADADGKIRRIPITLLYDDINLNFQSRYSCYKGKTLFCSGDGSKANQAFASQQDPKRVAGYKEVPCVCPRAAFEYAGADKCKMTGRLQFIIRGCERIGGVHYFRTTGRNSTTALWSSLLMFQRITGGPLAGIPLDLVVSPKQVADPTGMQQTIQVVALDFVGGFQALQEQAHNILLSNAKYGIQITHIEEEARRLMSGDPAPFAPVLDDEDQEEFFPGSQAGSQLSLEVVDTKTGEVTQAEPATGIDAAIEAAAVTAPTISADQQSQTRAQGKEGPERKPKAPATTPPAPEPLRNQEQLTEEDYQASQTEQSSKTESPAAPDPISPVDPAADDQPF